MKIFTVNKELELRLRKRENPFEGKNAVSVVEFRKSCKRWQLIIFNRKRIEDPEFDWRLTINEKRKVKPGTPWKAYSGIIHSWVEPWLMLSKKGEPLFIRPCIRFNPTLTIIPLRREGNKLMVGVTIEERAFGLMAGLPRRHVKFDKSGTNTEAIGAAATRLVEQEMHCRIDSKTYGEPIIQGPYFQVDATYLIERHPCAAVFVGEPLQGSWAADGIRAVQWFSLEEILVNTSKGVCELKLANGPVEQVDFTGSLEFGPLLLMLSKLMDLKTSWLQEQ